MIQPSDVSPPSLASYAASPQPSNFKKSHMVLPGFYIALWYTHADCPLKKIKMQMPPRPHSLQHLDPNSMGSRFTLNELEPLLLFPCLLS